MTAALQHERRQGALVAALHCRQSDLEDGSVRKMCGMLAQMADAYDKLYVLMRTSNGK
jgi:hypothetical protein